MCMEHLGHYIGRFQEINNLNASPCQPLKYGYKVV